MPFCQPLYVVKISDTVPPPRVETTLGWLHGECRPGVVFSTLKPPWKVVCSTPRAGWKKHPKGGCLKFSSTCGTVSPACEVYSAHTHTRTRTCSHQCVCYCIVELARMIQMNLSPKASRFSASNARPSSTAYTKHSRTPPIRTLI